MSREILLSIIPLLINHLTSQSLVIHSYAANCLEKIFVIKGPNGGTMYVLLFFLNESLFNPILFIILYEYD